MEGCDGRVRLEVSKKRPNRIAECIQIQASMIDVDRFGFEVEDMRLISHKRFWFDAYAVKIRTWKLHKGGVDLWQTMLIKKRCV